MKPAKLPGRVLLWAISALLLSPSVAVANSDASASGALTVDGIGPFAEDAVDAVAEELRNRGRVAQQTVKVTESTRPPAWYGRFDPVYQRSYFAPAISWVKCKASVKNCTRIPGLNKSYPYDTYIKDPTATGPAPAMPVMKLWYPKGSWSPSSNTNPGGALFYAYPFKYSPTSDRENPLSKVQATLEYDVFFPENFPWNKGGKLPGMSGGANNGKGCGGGANPNLQKCFSARIMWRRDGQGEAYIYVPRGLQTPDFCSRLPNCLGASTKYPCQSCSDVVGISFERGAFKFQAGKWNKVSLTIGLNTPNKTDGLLEVKHNGKTVIKNSQINWRQHSNVFIEGVEISTWFGGSDTTWGPPFDTYTLMRNFKAWRMDGPIVPSARTAALMNMAQGQVEEAEDLEVAD